MKQMATAWAFASQEGELSLVTRVLRLYVSMVPASLLLTAKKSLPDGKNTLESVNCYRDNEGAA